MPLALLVATLAPLLVASSAASRFDAVEVKASHVGGSVYLLEGAGGNIAASVGPDGILLVDDQFAPLAPKIRAALKGISDQPIRFVLNTHFHGDHTGGNREFGREATIIAHENVRRRLLPGVQEGEPKAVSALPVITFDDSLTVHFNGEEIRALHLPEGHTDGDSVILFRGSNVVHLGDQYFAGRFPFIDLDAGGSVEGLIRALRTLLAELPKDVKIIPGHGPLSTLPELRRYLAMLEDSAARVKAGIARGRTVEQLAEDRVLKRYEHLSWQFITTRQFLETLYREYGPASAETKSGSR